MKTLTTERLILREWKLSDVKDLYEYAQHPQVGPSAGWAPHKSEEESLEIIKMFLRDNNVYALELKSEKKVIGGLGLHEVTPEKEGITQKEIGYVLNPAYWGRGLIPEAVKKVIDYSFTELNIDILWCGHFSDNHKSRRVNEKCGFQYQLTKDHEVSYPEGKIVSFLMYCLQKEDYTDVI